MMITFLFSSICIYAASDQANNVPEDTSDQNDIFFQSQNTLTDDDQNKTDTLFFAIYSEDDDSLVFYSDVEYPEIGNIFSGKTVSSCFTLEESNTYQNAAQIPWCQIAPACQSVYIDDSFDNFHPESTAFWFSDFSSAMFLNLQHLNTENTTNMESMFSGCESIQELDLSMLAFNHVTNMSGMFSNCRQLTNIYLPFDTMENVTDFSEMLYGCFSIESLDFSTWNTSNVSSSNNFLVGCTSLNYITISDTFTLFTIAQEPITDIQTWYDDEGNVVSDNYLVDVCDAGMYYTYSHNANDEDNDDIEPYADGLQYIVEDPAYVEDPVITVVNQEIKTYRIEVQKTDEDGTLLEGATFILQNEDGDTLYFTSDGNTYTVCDSTDSGSSTKIVAGDVYIEGLKVGTYTLLETEAPAGYTKENEGMQIVVGDDDTTAVSPYISVSEYENDVTIEKVDAQDYSLKLANTAFTVSLEAEQTYGFYLSKMSNDGDTASQIVSSNVEFEMEDSDGNLLRFVYDENNSSYTLIDESDDQYYSDATEKIQIPAGSVYISHLKPGNYLLIETHAPDGYNPLKGSIDLLITEDGMFEGSYSSNALCFTSDNSTLYVLNSTGAMLPQTGPVQTVDPFSPDNYTDTISGTLIIENDSYVETKYTDSKGLISISPLYAGHYTIQETAASDGYDIVSKELEFFVNTNKTITYTDNAGAESSATGLWYTVGDPQSAKMPVITVVNKEIKTYNIELRKTDANTGKNLNGASFTLEDSNGDTLYFTINDNTYKIVDANDSDATQEIQIGNIVIQNLPEGSYTLSEIKAPSGYIKLADDITMVIDHDGTISVGDNDMTELQDNVIVIKNSTISLETLPNTGGHVPILIWMLGMFLTTLSFIEIVRNRRRERNYFGR